MLNSAARASDADAARAGLDGVALKPAECDVARAVDLPFESVTIDYEGRAHVPDRDLLARLARSVDLRVTVPVRADGFDPHGDDSLARSLPDGAGRVFVAGHPAYLTATERRRPVSGRLSTALADHDGGWVGTEGLERVALATGATQFELLSGTTAREFRALQAAGYEGGLAVYAPTVLTDDEDEILDAVGGYVARRDPVTRALPDDAATDSRAGGHTREVLLDAAESYALTGTPDRVHEHVLALKSAGADSVVGYPARGIEEFLRSDSAGD